jgi:4-amino-4-deoxy-L-arabinose transferase-like glycosyltransferase
MKTAQFESYVKTILIVLTAALISAVVILSWVPPVSRDALTHHLAVPRLYLQHGGIYEIPPIVFSYYPMNLDLLYIIPLYFGNDIVPKLIHFLFALLTAGLIYRYLKKRIDVVWACLGAFFFLSLPVIVKLSITVYVDLGLVFFSTGAIMGLIEWIESRFQLRFLIISAVSCGLALGTKYNGLVVLFILTVFVPLVYISKSRGTVDAKDNVPGKGPAKVQLKALGFGAIFCAVALLLFSPWMVRNYVWKGNPVYPLYKNVFETAKSDANDETPDESSVNIQEEDRSLKSKTAAARWGPFALRKVIYKESWWEIALIPVRIFFQGRDDDPKHFDGKLNPFLFLLPFFAFWRFSSDPPVLRTEKKVFVFFAVLFVLYAFSQTDMRIRYIAPVIPPLVVLSTFGLHRILESNSSRMLNLRGRLLTCGTLLLAVFMLSLNAFYIVDQFHHIRPFGYITGEMNRDAYIAKYRPEYTTIQYVNRNLSEKARILGLFLGNRRYYSDRDMIFGNNLFHRSVKAASSADLIVADMQRNGITHLLIRYDLFKRWAGVQFDDAEKKILKDFFENHLVQLFSQSGYGLFQVKPRT